MTRRVLLAVGPPYQTHDPESTVIGKQRQILLVACSGHKHRHLKRGPARDIYVGSLFRAGLAYAAENDMACLILSAKYGWVLPETEIETYNQKLTIQFNGPWPSGSGYFVGGSLYFGKAPESWRPLVTPGPIGKMTSNLLSLLRDPTQILGSLRRMKEGGVTDTIAKLLAERPISKMEILTELLFRFPGRKNMEATINAQLYQKRIGDERLVTLHQNGHLFWTTPGLPKSKWSFFDV